MFINDWKRTHLDNDEQDSNQHRSIFRGKFPKLKYDISIKPTSDRNPVAKACTKKEKERFNESRSMVQDRRK